MSKLQCTFLKARGLENSCLLHYTGGNVQITENYFVHEKYSLVLEKAVLQKTAIFECTSNKFWRNREPIFLGEKPIFQSNRILILMDLSSWPPNPYIVVGRIFPRPQRPIAFVHQQNCHRNWFHWRMRTFFPEDSSLQNESAKKNSQ